MLTRMLDWSLRNRAAVIVAWALVAVAGAWSLARLPLDAFPDTTPVQVQVNVTAPALAPVEVERRVTRPVEAALTGLPGLANLRSVSKFGFASVILTFEDGTGVWFARQVVAERLQAADLPPDVGRPSLGPVATGLGEVFHYLVTGEGHSLADLRAAQDWIVKPALRAVPGIAEINSWGGDERQVHVVADPEVLHRAGLTLADLVRALEENNANAGGGSIDSGGEAALVHGIGVLTSPAEVGEVVVAARDGVPVRVRDIARVVEGREVRRGAATADGKGEVVLGLAFLRMGENGYDVTRNVALRLEEVRKTLPPGIHATPVYDRTLLVDRVLATVRTNLLEGALLVVAVLFLFLGNLRAGLIVAAAIPLSLLFAGNLMLRFGIAGSLMSLGAIDFGLIVDSSVIQVENVLRRGGEGSEADRLRRVRDAVVEVRRPTLFGELIIAIVYLPVLALEGVEGRMFRPMALTVLFALAGSLLMSLTLVPALSSLFLARGTARAHGEVPLVRWLQRLYRPVLRAALDHPRTVVAVALLLVANGAFLATRLGSEFVPRLQEGSVVVNTVRLAGVSLDESLRYGTRIERAILDGFPDEVEHAWSRTGTAEVATDPMGLELTDIFLVLAPRDRWKRAKTQEELVRELSRVLGDLPGMRLIFTQPIEMRVAEMTAGVRADLAILVSGDEFPALEEAARAIDAAVRSVPGAVDVVTEQVTGQPVLEVIVDRQAAGRLGIPAREVLAVVEALAPRPAGYLQEGERRVPVAVRLEDRYRVDAQALSQARVASAGGASVPLSQVATIRTVEGPSTVTREWGRRRIVVQAGVRGRDLGGFVADVRRAVDRDVVPTLPPGYQVAYGGQFEHMERARDRLLVVVPLSLALILGLLWATYRRWADALRVFTGVPFAAVGGIAALWARDLPFSVPAAVGFIALSGVSVLGDMVLVSTIRQRIAAGLGLRAAIEDAAAARLRPVLMTSLVAALGFVPMALNTGFGAEVQRPLATVVIGGVVSSMLLTLVVLPVLYRLFAGRAAPAAEGDD